MVLIYDLETKTFGRPNPSQDELRVFGFYNLDTGEKSYLLSNQRKAIQELINRHYILIGFNVTGYDNIILEREGYDLERKRIIDLYDVVKKRKTLMKLDLKSYSLKNLAKHFNLTSRKQEDFNYDILKKDNFTPEDLKYIWDYLELDLEVTKELWEYLCDYFSGFKNYLNQKYIDNFSYVSCSGGSLAYKAICSQANIPEEYNEFKDDYKPFQGGYVSPPEQEFYDGDIYLFDFASLYPHSFMQANLYSHSCTCCKEEEKWHGNDVFDEIKGFYCTKQMGKIEFVIKKLFAERLELKKKLKEETDPSIKKELDRRQTSIKIIMNTMYGISGSPVFKHVYSLDTASDCTHIARSCIKFARSKFAEAGYTLVYTDTDSLFVQDPFKDEAKVFEVKKKIVEELKKKFPFPQETFDFAFDTKIKKIFFFKKNNSQFAKKFYLYLDYNKNLVVKGIPIVKSNCSRLSQKIFTERIVPWIKEKEDLNMSTEMVRGWIYEELKKDITLASFLCRTTELEYYKLDSQLQAQVAKKYGSGDHWIIPNYIYGAGLCLKYCSVEEFVEKKISYTQIALDNIFKELGYFCDRDFSNKNISRNQQVKIRRDLERNKMKQLSEWY